MGKKKTPLKNSGTAPAKRTASPKFFRLPGALFFLCLAVFILKPDFDFARPASAETAPGAVENALYTRQDFFGVPAVVPLPTAEARANLAKLAETAPADLQILEKLAELDEKLLDFDEAEKSLNRLAAADASKLELLAAFYERRARFPEQAEIVRKILFASDSQERPAIFARLLELDRKHELKTYREKAFYDRIVEENPELYAIFEQIADRLVEDGNRDEALAFVRRAKARFPERKSVFLEREIDILIDTGRRDEAIRVYEAAFDPFWSAEESEKFYEFLNREDRLRAYGARLKERFTRDPADFDAAVRLALFRNHDFSYGNDELTPIVLKLERRKKSWTTAELVAVTRLLIRANEAETASRFLYTLYLREDFKGKTDLRAKILYQLFEMFSDAEKRKLPITKGDLGFYADVAQADSSPGIATGLLSLVFSDTAPRRRLDEQEEEANKYFNRAAAYRIFLAYREEFPTSPELAQMHLDLVRLYTASKEPEIAEKILGEFEQRAENSRDYPSVALKLADAFDAARRPEKSRAIYQKVLDYLGKAGKPFDPAKNERPRAPANDSALESAPARNDGINVPSLPETSEYNDEEDDPVGGGFHDYLAREAEPVTYPEALEKLVASLAAEKKTAEILALYSNEIQKYPDEERLYEERLAWLERTNLLDEQLEGYASALRRFNSRSWQDRLARWFLRRNRDREFAEFSRDLIGKLNERETREYLANFVESGGSTVEFQKRLSLELYRAAHARFPHEPVFVGKLLNFYKINKMNREWRALAAEYYFEFREVREQYLDELAQTGELRAHLERARASENTIYGLFRADANARLSLYENAVEAYRKLNALYPNTPEFSERLIALTRSFGQKDRDALNESAALAATRADFLPSSAEYRTRSGEIYAEAGDFEKSAAEWEKLPLTARGEKKIYLATAAVYWDYFQYADALRTIEITREKFADETLYAFEAGAILEARQKTPEAVAEYVRALDAGRDETQKDKALERLTILADREKGDAPAGKALERIVDDAFSKERAKRAEGAFLALGYAEFLFKIDRVSKAENVLRRAVRETRDRDFIEAAKDFCESEENAAGARLALGRLAELAESPRPKIAYRLQLAESYATDKNRRSARAVLSGLLREYPTNYGVLIESADIYDRLGFENDSVAALAGSLPRSRGVYRVKIGGELARRLERLNRPADAARVLEKLHAEDASSAEIFRALAKIYVQTNDAAKLRRAFEETVAALRAGDADRREIDQLIADLRRPLIDAFTRLGDFESAVEQHIEIINRDPADEEPTEAAISYVKRHGGGETLLAYYQKTAAESFKNYRWYVVLARIFEARNDWENAARNYRAAIVNQPEMAELYLALAEIELKRNDFAAALANLDEVLRQTNDAPEYVKKKIEVLKKAGRFDEIEKEKEKLPVEEKTKVVAGEFAAARRMQSADKAKARELYREAFRKLLENPFAGQFGAADIAGYVESLREEEPLDRINERLWALRLNLAAKAGDENSVQAGEASKRLSVLEAAFPQSVGGIARTVGTDEELGALHDDWRRRLKENRANDFGGQRTLSLLVDLCRRAGFGDLEEEILRAKLESASPAADRKTELRNLVNFYDERGAYRKALTALEQFEPDDLPPIAERARLAGDAGKELEALRAIYRKAGAIGGSDDPNVARYLEILYAQNRGELKSLTETSSAHRLQLVNFLLGRGERELAHAAIESAALPASWKLARHAETSLALRELDENAECYFCEALQLDSIGNLVRQNPDKQRFLVGDDWFRLTREYGEWLYERRDRAIEPALYLTAMIENQPRNPKQQFNLGVFYLEKNDFRAAVEHLRLALELNPDDKEIWANLGAAYYRAGSLERAEAAWSKALAGADVRTGAAYFQILRKYGLTERARSDLAPVAVEFLKEQNADDSEDFRDLIRAIAASFARDEEKTAYFLNILKQRPTDGSLAEMLVAQSLVDKKSLPAFYELLIERSAGFEAYDYDYKYASFRQRNLALADAGALYDRENAYRPAEEPVSARHRWQMRYLRFLLDAREDDAARRLVDQIEKELDDRYAPPAKLRLAKIQLNLRGQTFDPAELERFAGITASDSAANAIAPSLERLNDLLEILKAEKRETEARRLSESFFARLLALGQLRAVNFRGLSWSLFEQGKTDQARRVLQLMTDASDPDKTETAAAEIAALDVVRRRAAANDGETNEPNESPAPAEALQNAAEVAAAFGQTDDALAFRRQLLEIAPADAGNRIELAKIFLARGASAEARELLTSLSGDRAASRVSRWRARLLLSENGAAADFPDRSFDAYSRFYAGLIAARQDRKEAAGEYFVDSLTADKDAEIPARLELIKIYAAGGRSFAALKLGETEPAAKTDELLRALSEAAENVGDYARALVFERGKSAPDESRVVRLEGLREQKDRKATDFRVDPSNTRKL
jgi:tetratricopeptide (TPR) repeat protein